VVFGRYRTQIGRKFSEHPLSVGGRQGLAAIPHHHERLRRSVLTDCNDIPGKRLVGVACAAAPSASSAGCLSPPFTGRAHRVEANVRILEIAHQGR
jgi:hypothetical protein